MPSYTFTVDSSSIPNTQQLISASDIRYLNWALDRDQLASEASEVLLIARIEHAQADMQTSHPISPSMPLGKKRRQKKKDTIFYGSDDDLERIQRQEYIEWITHVDSSDEPFEEVPEPHSSFSQDCSDHHEENSFPRRSNQQARNERRHSSRLSYISTEEESELTLIRPVTRRSRILHSDAEYSDGEDGQATSVFDSDSDGVGPSHHHSHSPLPLIKKKRSSKKSERKNLMDAQEEIVSIGLMDYLPYFSYDSKVLIPYVPQVFSFSTL